MNDLTAFEAVICIASIIVAGWLVIGEMIKGECYEY